MWFIRQRCLKKELLALKICNNKNNTLCNNQAPLRLYLTYVSNIFVFIFILSSYSKSNMSRVIIKNHPTNHPFLCCYTSTSSSNIKKPTPNIYAQDHKQRKIIPKSFTRNYQDNSTEAGFQFTFYCDICNDGYKSSFIESETYKSAISHPYLKALMMLAAAMKAS